MAVPWSLLVGDGALGGMEKVRRAIIPLRGAKVNKTNRVCAVIVRFVRKGGGSGGCEFF